MATQTIERESRGATLIRFARRRNAPPLRIDLAEMPDPVEQCDGTWRVPMWSPDRGWELVEMENPDEDAPYVAPQPRAACGDPECDALHEEEFFATMLVNTK